MSVGDYRRRALRPWPVLQKQRLNVAARSGIERAQEFSPRAQSVRAPLTF
jgi:hypothetical protein